MTENPFHSFSIYDYLSRIEGHVAFAVPTFDVWKHLLIVYGEQTEKGTGGGC